MAIIGYSLPRHDEYARQVIYRLVTTYQSSEEYFGGTKEKERDPLLFVDFCRTDDQERQLLDRYRFVDWTQAQKFLEGFDDEVIKRLST